MKKKNKKLKNRIPMEVVLRLRVQGSVVPNKKKEDSKNHLRRMYESF
jgi:phosphoribosylaminoimidazole-succinocarboxamide synthase